MSAYTPFYQKEDLTTRLRNILDEYPTGTGPFKEFLQNADDARARRFALSLDKTWFPTGKLLAPTMSAWQGPALLVMNDSVFTEADFQSISHVGQSGKFTDATKIGKYGLGFNVAYHFTDVPTFVSDDQLVAFDPHGRFLPSGLPGLRCAYMEGTNQVDLEDQLRPFAQAADVFTPSHALGQSKHMPGTIFRLPLRTQELADASLISTSMLTPEKLAEQLIEFSAQVAESLLFLKSVEEVSVFTPSAEADRPELLCRAVVQGADESLRKSRCTPQGNVEDATDSNYLLVVETTTHASTGSTKSAPPAAQDARAGRQARVEELTRSRCTTWQVLSGEATGAAGAESLATELHQVQITGVAARADGQRVEGRAYCFLPLPVRTGLPVHLNAAFALTSNRRDLWRGGDDGGGSSAAKAAWNMHLLTQLGTKYATVIEMSAEQYEDNTPEGSSSAYALWPDLQEVSKPFDTSAIAALRDIISQNRKVWWSVYEHRLFTFDEIVFASDAFTKCCTDLKVTSQALRKAGIIVINPPPHVRDGVACAGESAKVISARQVSDALRAAVATGTAAEEMSRHEAGKLLEFFLLGWEEWDQARVHLLEALPLIPLADGSLGVFTTRRKPAASAQYWILERQFHGMFTEAMRAQLVDPDSPMINYFSKAAFQAATNVKNLTPEGLRMHVSHIVPENWRGKAIVCIGTGGCGSDTERSLSVRTEPANEPEPKVASVIGAEEDGGWVRPSKKKKKRSKAKTSKNKVHADAIRKDGREAEPSGEDIGRRLAIFWAFVQSCPSISKSNPLFADKWPLVPVGGVDCEDTTIEYVCSLDYARTRALLRPNDYSLDEAKCLMAVGCLFLSCHWPVRYNDGVRHTVPTGNRVLNSISVSKRECLSAAVTSFELGVAQVDAKVAKLLQQLLLQWLGECRDGFSKTDEHDDGEGVWTIQKQSTRQFVDVTVEAMRKLPVFETIAGTFLPADDVNGSCCTVTPSELWDTLLAPVFADRILKTSGDEADEWFRITGIDQRPNDVDFFVEWLLPKFKHTRETSEDGSWISRELSIATLRIIGEHKLWKHKYGTRIISIMSNVNLVVSDDGSRCKVETLVDPDDTVFRHIYRYTSPNYPAAAYASDALVMNAMRHIGLRSMNVANVFCETARAVKPDDVESGRLIVEHLVTHHPDWSSAQWAEVQSIPFLPAYDFRQMQDFPTMPFPTAKGMVAVRVAQQMEDKGKHKKTTNGRKAGKGFAGKGAHKHSRYDVQDDYADDERDDEIVLFDDVMPRKILGNVEALLRPERESKSDHGSVPRLISFAQAAKGDACAAANCWTAWTQVLVMDSVCERLPPKIKERLRLRTRTPLPTLLKHLCTIVRTWMAADKENSSVVPAWEVSLRQGLILLSILEIHESLKSCPTTKVKAERAFCSAALSKVPLCLHDDGTWALPREVFVDLEEDLGPRVRAPPKSLQPFYYLLQLCGSPRVPEEHCPIPKITAASTGILNEIGMMSLTTDLRSRHPLADVMITTAEGITFYGHMVVLASTCEFFRTSLVGPLARNDRVVCDGGPDMLHLDLSQNEWLRADSFEAMLRFLYGCDIEALDSFGVRGNASSAGDTQEASTVLGDSFAPKTLVVSEESVVVACELLRLADHYDLDELKQRCECYLSAPSVMNVHNCCDVLVQSTSCNADQLTSAAIFYVISMRDLVTATEEWKQLPAEIKRLLL